jgi:hypothetical protein
MVILYLDDTKDILEQIKRLSKIYGFSESHLLIAYNRQSVDQFVTEQGESRDIFFDKKFSIEPEKTDYFVEKKVSYIKEQKMLPKFLRNRKNG